jgi:hypothetical protein
VPASYKQYIDRALSAFLSSPFSHPPPPAFTLPPPQLQPFSTTHNHFNSPTQHHPNSTKMRYSFALLAGVVAAVPQLSVQPISQISDGQIQAPPATVVPPVSKPTPVVPSVSAPVVAPSVPVSAPAGKSTLYISHRVSHMLTHSSVTPAVPTATPVVPSAPVVPVPGGNSTAPASGTGSSASKSPSSPTASSSTGTPESTGAAGVYQVSFGGLVLAIGAAVLA